MTNETIKVRVTVEVEVDRAKYDAEYGVHASASDIREHIKGEVGTAANSAFENINAVEVTDWR